MNEIKIGISGNPIGEGGYNNLVNIGFDPGLLERQFSYKGTHNNEYSIEIQQGDTEAIYILVLNPLYVYSSGASRGGALCVFLSIPARKYMLKRNPLELLRDILEKFRNENMIKKGDVWEYQYKAYYDRESFLDLSKQVENDGLADLPTYVPMKGDSELLVSIGDELEAFFAGDFQYPKFKDCNRLVIADHIDDSTWKPTEIPRPWFLKVKYNGNKGAELKNTNDKEHPITINLDPSDKVCYKPTEIKLWLDGYQVKTSNCTVKEVNWENNEVLIDNIEWIDNDRFVPVCIDDGIELSPEQIVCTFDDGMHPKVEIQAEKNPNEVLGFVFLGSQIRDVKEEMFHISNEDYNFTVRLESEGGLPEEIHIKAVKNEPSQKTSEGDTVKDGVGSFGSVTPKTVVYTLQNFTGEAFVISVAGYDNNGGKISLEPITLEKGPVTKKLNKNVPKVIISIIKEGNGPVTEVLPQQSKSETNTITLQNSTGEAFVISVAGYDNNGGEISLEPITLEKGPVTKELNKNVQKVIISINKKEPVTESHGEDDVVKTAYTLTNATGEALVVSKLEFIIKDSEKPKTFSEKFTLEDGNSKEYDLEECKYRKLQRVITYFKKYVKLEKDIVDIKNREIKIGPSDLKLKIYRQPGFWPGVGVGTFGMFILGLLIFCAVWVYSLFPDSDATALLKCKIPQVTQQSLFIYDSLELTTAIHYYVSCSDENDEIKRKKDSLLPVIRNQVEHITNLLYKLDYKDYQLTFDDPKIIQNWIDESGICNLKAQITDIDTLMRYCPKFVESGSLIKTLLVKIPENERDYDKTVTKEDYDKLTKINADLKGEHFKPIRMCIQGFYGPKNCNKNGEKNDYAIIFKGILDNNEEVRNYHSFAQIEHNFKKITQ